MSFKVYLYTLSKRDNSTKRPDTEPLEYDCILKDGCSIFTPSIKLDMGLTRDPSVYNYAYIPAFSRYYFIEDWFFTDRLWIANLRVDVLATYKPKIGSSSLYILRAAGDHDGNIIDTLYPAKTGCSFESDIKSNPWNTTGCFVVGIVAGNANFGSLNYYAMDSSDLAGMCKNLTDPEFIITEDNFFTPTELSMGLQLSLVDPIQYVKSCIMLPIAKEEITNTSSDTIKVYNYDQVGNGDIIRPTSRIYKTYTFSLLEHPDTIARGNYVNSAPYTDITLTIPPYGCIQIDTSVTCNASSLSVEIELDPITGKGILIVKAIIGTKSIILNRIESQIGVPISLSSVTRDYIGAASSALGAIGSIVAGAIVPSSGAIIGGVQGIGNAVESLQPRSNTIGTTGSFVANRGDFRLDYQFFRPVEDDNTHNGRPLCKVRRIDTLSGYMLVQDGDVSIAGTASEDSRIRNYLETGFYFE